MEIVGYIATMVALLGVVLNVKKQPVCFVLWCGSNLTFTIINLYQNRYYEVVLFSVQFVIAVWGLHEWLIKPRAINHTISEYKWNELRKVGRGWCYETKEKVL